MRARARVQLHLDESVPGPEVRAIGSRAGFHRTHKLPALCLVVVQVEAVAVLAFHHVTQAGDKLVRGLRRRLRLLGSLQIKGSARSAMGKQKNNDWSLPVNFKLNHKADFFFVEVV